MIILLSLQPVKADGRPAVSGSASTFFPLLLSLSPGRSRFTLALDEPLGFLFDCQRRRWDSFGCDWIFLQFEMYRLIGTLATETIIKNIHILASLLNFSQTIKYHKYYIVAAPPKNVFIVNSSYPDINIQSFDVCDYFSSMIKKMSTVQSIWRVYEALWHSRAIMTMCCVLDPILDHILNT